MEGEEEKALAAACARRDPGSLERLLAIHGAALTAACRRAVALARGRVSAGEVEEAEAEVRRRLWAGAEAVFGRFRGDCPLEAWIRLVAYRTALNHLAAESRRGHPALRDVHASAAPAASEALEVREDLARLREGLTRLDPEDRLLLEEAYLKGRSYREVARAAGVAPGSVGPLLLRARQRLAKIVGSLS